MDHCEQIYTDSCDITFFYKPEIPVWVTKNFVLAPLTSSLGGTNRKFNLHAEKHS
jgi:hypothetical protein